MLAPDSRFQFFLSDDWDQEWRVKYRASFREALVPYQNSTTGKNGTITSSVEERPNSKLSKLLNGQKAQAKALKPAGDEMTQYLDGGKLGSLQYL
jgi:hypothetical protein